MQIGANHESIIHVYRGCDLHSYLYIGLSRAEVRRGLVGRSKKHAAFLLSLLLFADFIQVHCSQVVNNVGAYVKTLCQVAVAHVHYARRPKYYIFGFDLKLKIHYISCDELLRKLCAVFRTYYHGDSILPLSKSCKVGSTSRRQSCLESGDIQPIPNLIASVVNGTSLFRRHFARSRSISRGPQFLTNLDHMDPRLVAFEDFLRDAGATFDSNAIAFTTSEVHGFGVVARSSLKKGTVIATVPKTAILSIRTASLWKDVNQTSYGQSNCVTNLTAAPESDGAQPVLDSLCPPVFQLAAAVLFESLQAERSPWSRYLSILPRSLAEIGIPLAETEADIADVCKGTGIEVVSGLMRAKLRAAFDEFVAPLLVKRAKQLGLAAEMVEGVKLDRFMLAFAWVTSRAFEVDTIHGNSLVPIADMFNHKTDDEHVHIEGATEDSDSEDDESEEEFQDDDEEDVHNRNLSGGKGAVIADGGKKCSIGASLEDSPVDVLKIVCVQDVAAGDEIFNTFGQKNNTILYLCYGFTEEHNSYDTGFVHKSDIERILKDFSAGLADVDCHMTDKRQSCIEAAKDIIEDDVVDHFFQVSTDGSFCHGIMLLIYLHIVPWKALAPFYDDEFELLEHLMRLSVLDILDVGARHVAEIVTSIKNRQLLKFPEGTSIATDEAALATAPRDMPPLVRNTLRIRIGQRKALQAACDQLLSYINTADEYVNEVQKEETQPEGVEPKAKRKKVG